MAIQGGPLPFLPGVDGGVTVGTVSWLGVVAAATGDKGGTDGSAGVGSGVTLGAKVAVADGSVGVAATRGGAVGVASGIDV